jgi:hypothetical protein
MFERLFHHLFGNERSHNSRHDCDTQGAVERMIRHSTTVFPSSVVSMETLALLVATVFQCGHR